MVDRPRSVAMPGVALDQRREHDGVPARRGAGLVARRGPRRPECCGPGLPATGRWELRGAAAIVGREGDHPDAPAGHVLVEVRPSRLTLVGPARLAATETIGF
jgi:hypothetical protein